MTSTTTGTAPGPTAGTTPGMTAGTPGGPPPEGPDWATRPPPPSGSRGTGIAIAGAIAIVVLLGAAGLLLAVDATTVERTDTFADVAAISLDLDNADVELVVGAVALVEQRVSAGRFGGTATAEVRDGTLRVVHDCPWFNDVLFGLGCEGSYRLAVPPGIAVTGGTGNGDVRLTGVDGRIDLRSSNGAFHLVDVSGPITVHTSNGEVVGTGLESTQVRATTSNGEVVLGFTTAPERVRADTSNGTIEVVVPDDGASFAIDPSTSNGHVTAAVPTEESSSRRLALHTSNGDIVVRTPR